MRKPTYMAIGRFEVPLEAPVVAVLGLAVDQEPEALLEAERGIVGALQLLDERAGHPAEVEGVELVEGRRREHFWVLLLTRLIAGDLLRSDGRDGDGGLVVGSRWGGIARQ